MNPHIIDSHEQNDSDLSDIENEIAALMAAAKKHNIDIPTIAAHMIIDDTLDRGGNGCVVMLEGVEHNGRPVGSWQLVCNQTN